MLCPIIAPQQEEQLQRQLKMQQLQYLQATKLAQLNAKRQEMLAASPHASASQAQAPSQPSAQGIHIVFFALAPLPFACLLALRTGAS